MDFFPNKVEGYCSRCMECCKMFDDDGQFFGYCPNLDVEQKICLAWDDGYHEGCRSFPIAESFAEGGEWIEHCSYHLNPILKDREDKQTTKKEATIKYDPEFECLVIDIDDEVDNSILKEEKRSGKL